MRSREATAKNELVAAIADLDRFMAAEGGTDEDVAVA